jgi:single-strand DNA-binding protein
VLDNTVVVVGNLAADPEYRRLDSGAEVANFRVGSTRRRFDKDSGHWVDGETSWWRVACWRGLAANCATSLRRGDRVLVVGRVRTSSWEKDDGRSGTSLEIEADAVGHDLTWGTSSFKRVVRSERLDLPENDAHEPAEDDRDEFAAGLGLRVDADGVVVDAEEEPVTA